jgi:hypothetical protein
MPTYSVEVTMIGVDADSPEAAALALRRELNAGTLEVRVIGDDDPSSTPLDEAPAVQLPATFAWVTNELLTEIAYRLLNADSDEFIDPTPADLAPIHSWWTDHVEGRESDWDEYGTHFVDRLERGYRTYLRSQPANPKEAP